MVIEMPPFYVVFRNVAYFMLFIRDFCSYCSSKRSLLIFFHLQRSSLLTAQSLIKVDFLSKNWLLILMATISKLGKKYDDQIVKNVVMAKYPSFYGRKKLVNL